MSKKGSNPPPPEGSRPPPPPPPPPPPVRVINPDRSPPPLGETSVLLLWWWKYFKKLQEEEDMQSEHPTPKAPTGQGERYNSGKPKLSMLREAPDACIGITRVLEFGEKKYDRANWLKGLPYTEIIDSMDRHTLEIMKGNNIDEESGLPHADHLACNALFLSQMMATRPDMDDRVLSTESTRSQL